MPADIDDSDWNRCFLALTPSAGDAGRLARLAASAAPPAAHRLAGADLHATLAFFGRIAPAAGRALAGMLHELGSAPLALDMIGLACWPSPQRPRVLVAEFAQTPALMALLGAVHERMRGLGLPIEERPYRPHVTLARFPYHHDALANPPLAAQPPLRGCRFDTLALYTSVAPAPGRRYRALACTPLRVAPPA